MMLVPRMTHVAMLGVMAMIHLLVMVFGMVMARVMPRMMVMFRVMHMTLCVVRVVGAMGRTTRMCSHTTILSSHLPLPDAI